MCIIRTAYNDHCLNISKDEYMGKVKASKWNSFSILRWCVIAVFFLVIIASGILTTGVISDIITILTVFSIFTAAMLHGYERYGLKNLIVFFGITWLVSLFFEVLSIKTGFPFGHYYYDKLMGPRLFEVPILIMLAYFGAGYASWMLANILLGQYSKRITGKRIFLIPFVATFIMVMWDICMDPISSTIDSLWVWKDGGSYFGVPLQNYFGWFLVVFIIYQLFALYISKYERKPGRKIKAISTKSFWLEAIVIYGILGFAQVEYAVLLSEHKEIYGPLGMLSIFTMLFVAFLALIALRNADLSKTDS